MGYANPRRRLNTTLNHVSPFHGPPPAINGLQSKSARNTQDRLSRPPEISTMTKLPSQLSNKEPMFQWMQGDGKTLTNAGDDLLRTLRERGIHGCIVSAPPAALDMQYRAIFTADSMNFISDLQSRFETEIDAALLQRKIGQSNIESGILPDFNPETRHIREGNWKVSPLPKILLDRRIDVGDITPADPVLLANALNSGASGVQVDFDDGHCPNWENQIKSYYHLSLASHGSLNDYVKDSAPQPEVKRATSSWLPSWTRRTPESQPQTNYQSSGSPLSQGPPGSRSSSRANSQSSSSWRRPSSTQHTQGQPSYGSSQQSGAIIMCRPRAWNMRERHVMINGREIMGALLDFGLHMFHNAAVLHQTGRGPFLYLSKVESQQEAKLWNDMFTWSEQRLGLPLGTIRACVLIENVVASFQMHEILWELRTHAIGLNCGMWDYAASFVNKFRHDISFVLPSRSEYVTMDKRFMASYRHLVVQTSHIRGCIATGGMTPLAEIKPLPRNASSREKRAHADKLRVREGEIKNVLKSKASEFGMGADGCLVNDLTLIPGLYDTWERVVGRNATNQMDNIPDGDITQEDILACPKGDIPLQGLVKNVTVGILFVEAWMRGEGYFILDGRVEDSATAEISRSQVWQWLRHQVCLNDGRPVTRLLVRQVIYTVLETIEREREAAGYHSTAQRDNENEKLRCATRLFETIVNMRDFPDFITTYLYEQDVFWQHSDVCWL